jgi:hypothetical protein
MSSSYITYTLEGDFSMPESPETLEIWRSLLRQAHCLGQADDGSSVLHLARKISNPSFVPILTDL